jgi:hypothetical protein
MSPGGATRGKWRISDEKVGEVCYHIRTSEGGFSRLCQLRTDHLALVRKFDYVLTHKGFMRSHKFSSFDGH